ncbi:ABC transporter permease [Micromonospora sp. NPDC003197]
MLRAMLRDLRAHRTRLAMTLLSVVLGVAFVVATWVISDSNAQTVAGGERRHDIGVAVQTVGRGGAKLTEADRDRLAKLPGVTNAATVFIGRAALVGSTGKLVTAAPERGGTNWDGSSRFHLLSGRPPAGAGEVAIEERAATEAGLRIGDAPRVILADGSSHHATLVGLYLYRPIAREETPVAAYEPATARNLLGGSIDRVELTLATGMDPRSVAQAVDELLGADRYLVGTGPELRAVANQQAERDTAMARNLLLGCAAVALLVGTFVIANTFTMLVAQRVRQFALLRAVGASPRQIRRAVLAEAGLVGLIGGTVGLALGIGIGVVALHLLRPAGQSVMVAVSPTAIAAGYAVGILVTVAAAYGSARRGAAVPPIAALRTDAGLPRRSLKTRRNLGGAALVAGLAAVAATAGTGLSSGQRVLAVAGALSAWIGVLLLAPMLVVGTLRPMSRWADRRGGPAVRLAIGNTTRDPRRTAATTSALMLGLALICTFATVGETLRVATAQPVRDTVPATTTVVRSPSSGIGLAETTVDTITSTTGVAQVGAVRWAAGEVTHGPARFGATISAIEPAGVGTALTPPITAGSADLTRGALVPADRARELGIRPGDRLTIRYDKESSVEVAVVGTYRTSEVLTGIVVDVAVVPERFRDYIHAAYATGPDPAAVRSALDTAFADRPDVVVTDRAGSIEQVLAPFALMLSVLYALLGTAVVIAVFGVVNTLALAVVERTREVGVLRAIGASRRLVRGTVRWESMVLSLYGGLLGILVGLVVGAVLQHAILDRPLWGLMVPYPVFGVALAGMMLVGMVAAVWPARRAARTDILTAIAAG